MAIEETKQRDRGRHPTAGLSNWPLVVVLKIILSDYSLLEKTVETLGVSPVISLRVVAGSNDIFVLLTPDQREER